MALTLDSSSATFVILSFEGPDAYSRAGGLGTRVTELSATLAEMGFPVHLLFVGDPDQPGREERISGNLTLHRWCQWISNYYPNGVYHGEDDKVRDFTTSSPQFIVDEIVRPAVAEGRLVIVLAEEWHTAGATCAVSDLLVRSRLKRRAVTLWNANNTMGFDRVGWDRLDAAATITTVRARRQISLSIVRRM